MKKYFLRVFVSLLITVALLSGAMIPSKADGLEGLSILERALKGDVNNDGMVDVQDVFGLLYSFVFPDLYDVNAVAAIDFTEDETVTIQDAVFLLYHVEFPEEAAYEPQGKLVDASPAILKYGNRPDADAWERRADYLTEAALHEFNEAYREALEELDYNRHVALSAIAEAKLYESATVFPTNGQGGNYKISRVVDKTIPSVKWGLDGYRYHSMIVTNELIKNSDRAAMLQLWAGNTRADQYLNDVRNYLLAHGYTFKDSYQGLASTFYQNMLDIHTSNRASQLELLTEGYEGLYHYDALNNLVPAIAEDYSVSPDGLTYRFTLRDDVDWVNVSGEVVGRVKADDFVAGMQHAIDGGMGFTLEGVIKNAYEYRYENADFSTVGVRAISDTVLEYELEKATPYFMTLLGYAPFFPLNRAFYEANGGGYGRSYNSGDNYTYGTSLETILFCGPMILDTISDEELVLRKNQHYFDQGCFGISEYRYTMYEGIDPLEPYSDCVYGITDAVGLNNTALERCKEDGLFDTYASQTSLTATTYIGNLDLNRMVYANKDDETVMRSQKTVYEADVTSAAMENVHFRRALIASMDRASYIGVAYGEEWKYTMTRNTYVPGDFVRLSEDVTIDINGTPVLFPGGTSYGAIIQAQLDADGSYLKVWDEATQSDSGFDGWYDPEAARQEFALAVADLVSQGYVVDADHPIVLDFITGYSETAHLQGDVLKSSIESALGGNVVVNVNRSKDFYGYYCAAAGAGGKAQNHDFCIVNGWGPDYGDPMTYLDAVYAPRSGYLLTGCGLY